MLRKGFAAALLCAATVTAKKHFAKSFHDYMHVSGDRLDPYLVAPMVSAREAAVKAGDDVPKLTIHLVPHTHDDIGWLKTVDGYYSGVDQETAVANVSEILDTVVAALLLDETKVFTYVEMKFFSMWFYRQTEAKQE